MQIGAPKAPSLSIGAGFTPAAAFTLPPGKVPAAKAAPAAKKRATAKKKTDADDQLQLPLPNPDDLPMDIVLPKGNDFATLRSKLSLPYNSRLIIMTDSRASEVMDVLQPVLGPLVLHNNLVTQVCEVDKRKLKALPDVYPGDTVLVMGKTPVERLTEEWGVFDKGRSYSYYRHQETVRNGVVFHTCASPYMALRDYPTQVEVRLDALSAARRALTGTSIPVGGLGQYHWVDDLEALCHEVQNRFDATNQPVPLSWDLECVGLDEHNPAAWIVSIFFTISAGHSVGVPFHGHRDQPVPPDNTLFKQVEPALHERKSRLWSQINWLLNTPKVKGIGANLKFDKRWIAKKWEMECTNHVFDTTLVGGLLDENRSNSLNVHTKIYAPDLGGYDDLFNTTVDKGRMDLALAADPDSFRIYAGGDTDAALRIYPPMRQQLIGDPKLTNLYLHLLHPASDFFCRMEQVGVLADLEEYARLKVVLEEELARLQAEADALFPERLKARHKYDTKLSKPAVISDYFFSDLGLGLRPLEYTAKTKGSATPKPTTEYTHLVKFKHHSGVSEFLKIYKAYNSASKTLSTYVVGFLQHIKPDSRFHATYLLHKSDKGGDTGEAGGGTVTGRLAATGPAMQTIPSKTEWAKPLRKCLVAPEGYVVAEIDYSQGELRVAAVVARVRAMIESYQNEEDLHVLAGSLACGLNPEEVKTWKKSADPALVAKFKFVRQNGKAANFGLLYGMQAEGYMNYARDSYGVDMTLEQALFARDQFFNLYPELLLWHDAYQDLARRQGFIVSPLGRVRHLPLIHSRDSGLRSQAERQAINSPIQATLSDMTVLSGVEFELNYGRFGRDNPVQFCMMVHDALYCYLPEDQVDVWIPRIVEVMENLPLAEKFGWYNIPIKFKAEPEVGPNLAAKQEIFFTDDHLRTVLKWPERLAAAA